MAQYDIVVFGATSFVGKIICRELLALQAKGEQFSWAMAGRNRSKLTDLGSELGVKAHHIDKLVADAANLEQLRELCQSTKVVLSTVGPYALYGEPLVRACAETGTDYCDLCGEPQWIKRMINSYHQTALGSGARIVTSCGFDSIPSDMGVMFLQALAWEAFGEPCNTVTMRVKASRGGASGGTIASMLNLMQEAARDPQLRKDLRNVYSLCPAGTPVVREQHSISKAQLDPDYQRWIAPFVMAAINERIVQRSHVLRGFPYGQDFTYNEGMLMKSAWAARGLAVGMGAFMGAAALGPLRALLAKALPAPGEGPSEEQQKSGFYDLRFIGKTASGQQIATRVLGKGDPGYGSTARIIAQAALSLAFDISADDCAGGLVTPAATFDQRFIKRLSRYADVSFDRLETSAE